MLHISGIGFRSRVRLEASRRFEKNLRLRTGNRGKLIIASSPQFGRCASRTEAQDHAWLVRPVGLVRLPAINGKTVNYWHAPGFKTGGLGEPDAAAIALKDPGNPKPLA